MVVTDKAVRAAAAKIAGPTVWAQEWRRPAFETVARAALAAAIPHLESGLASPRTVITITQDGETDGALDFKVEFDPPYLHSDEHSNPDTHLMGAHFMVWMQERMEARGHLAEPVAADIEAEFEGEA